MILFIIKVIICLSVIAVAIFLGGLVLKKLPNFAKVKSGERASFNIKNILAIDVKRKILHIEYLQKEYILLIGGNNDILVDSFEKISEAKAITEIKDKINKEIV